MERRKLIWSYHQKGLTREQIFEQVCADSKILAVPAEQVSEWFDLANNSDDAYRRIGAGYYNIISEILAELDKLQNAIAVWTDVKVIRSLDSRYAIALCEVKDQFGLYLLDNYRGEKSQLQLSGLTSEQLSACKMFCLDCDHLLLCEEHEFSRFVFYLMRLNLPDLKCTKLDQIEVSGYFENIIFDCSRHDFLFYYSNFHNTMSFLLRFKVEDSRLTQIQGPIQFEQTLRCERLKNDCLQTFGYIHDAEDGLRSAFGYHNLTDNPAFVKLIDKKEDAYFGKIYISRCTWNRDKCYMFGFQLNDPRRRLFILNAETGDFFLIKIDLFLPGNIMDMHLDDDESILTVCTRRIDNGDSDVVIRRFTLKTPDTLANLALFKMRKDAIFYGSKLYEQFVSRFPSSQ